MLVIHDLSPDLTCTSPVVLDSPSKRALVECKSSGPFLAFGSGCLLQLTRPKNEHEVYVLARIFSGQIMVRGEPDATPLAVHTYLPVGSGGNLPSSTRCWAETAAIPVHFCAFDCVNAVAGSFVLLHIPQAGIAHTAVLTEAATLSLDGNTRFIPCLCLNASVLVISHGCR